MIHLATQADRKRKYSFFSSGSSSPIPVVKRARPLAVESDGSFDAGSQGGASTSNAPLATTIEPSVLHERIKFLTEAFPKVDKEVRNVCLYHSIISARTLLRIGNINFCHFFFHWVQFHHVN